MSHFTAMILTDYGSFGPTHARLQLAAIHSVDLWLSPYVVSGPADTSKHRYGASKLVVFQIWVDPDSMLFPGIAGLRPA